jgi:hypothetical protein
MVTKREADRENMPGLPIEKKPGNVNTAPPAGERSREVENSPSPYDQAKPGTPENRIIRQGEPEQPATASGDEPQRGGSGSQPGEVAVGLGDGLEGAPVEDVGNEGNPPAGSQSMKGRHSSTSNDGLNEVQPSRQADAEVGLGDAMEGAPVEEYEDEMRKQANDSREKRSA